MCVCLLCVLCVCFELVVAGRYHDLARVCVNPSGLSSTFAHFVPQEESVETNVVDRALLESELIVLMAGFVAEQLTFGDKNVSVLGNADVEQARALATQMASEYGMGKRVGLLAFAEDETTLSEGTAALLEADVTDLLEAAEVKAYMGLARNWRLFEQLSRSLYDEKQIMGADFEKALRSAAAWRIGDLDAESTTKEKIVYPSVSS